MIFGVFEGSVLNLWWPESVYEWYPPLYTIYANIHMQTQAQGIIFWFMARGNPSLPVTISVLKAAKKMAQIPATEIQTTWAHWPPTSKQQKTGTLEERWRVAEVFLLYKRLRPKLFIDFYELFFILLRYIIGRAVTVFYAHGCPLNISFYQKKKNVHKHFNLDDEAFVYIMKWGKLARKSLHFKNYLKVFIINFFNFFFAFE